MDWIMFLITFWPVIVIVCSASSLAYNVHAGNPISSGASFIGIVIGAVGAVV